MRQHRKVIFGLAFLLCLTAVLTLALWNRSRSVLSLKALQDAKLVMAYQQRWDWSHRSTRMRTRRYQATVPFDDVVRSIRAELQPLGWTEHPVKSKTRILLFMEKTNGYVVGVESPWENPTGPCMIYVSDPIRRASPTDKMVAWLQGFDKSYSMR